ncbi:MAG: hypothetical protein JJU08_10670 [Rhodobacteraceae bacterium]|nr:hypothetical protein [Paracoccaceae bacterium]
MSYRDYQAYLQKKGSPRTDADGGEIALRVEDAIAAVKLLHETDVGILGGDIYHIEEDGYFRPTYENWHTNKTDEELDLFPEISRKRAEDYLSRHTGRDAWCVLVLDT